MCASGVSYYIVVLVYLHIINYLFIIKISVSISCIRSRSRRSSNGSGAQTPTPRNSGHHGDSEHPETNGVMVNGDETESKHKVNGNTSPIKSKLAADGSNNNDIDSIPNQTKSIPIV